MTKLTAKQENFAQGKHYVYMLINPINDQCFYIGKGCGDRAQSHYKQVKSGNFAPTKKNNVIRKIIKAGLEPRVEIVKSNLTEEQALLLERVKIKKTPNLTNVALNNRKEVLSKTVKDIVDVINSTPNIEQAMQAPAEQIKATEAVFGSIDNYVKWANEKLRGHLYSVIAGVLSDTQVAAIMASIKSEQCRTIKTDWGSVSDLMEAT